VLAIPKIPTGRLDIFGPFPSAVLIRQSPNPQKREYKEAERKLLRAKAITIAPHAHSAKLCGATWNAQIRKNIPRWNTWAVGSGRPRINCATRTSLFI
jgi:hypothetical protein